MNYTYYNKLKKIKLLKKTEMVSYINNEFYNISQRIKDSKWKTTTAIEEYLKILELSKKYINYPFGEIIMKTIIKNKIKNFNKKIRIAFFVNEFSVFPSVKSVYDTMSNDVDFICDLVHIPFNHVNKTGNSKREIDAYKKRGYTKIISDKDYKLNEVSPDIIVYLKPYDLIPDKYYIYEIEKVCDYVIYIPYGIHGVADKEIFRYAYQLPIIDKAWINISHSKHNQELAKIYSKQKGKNFYMIGHPRMDLINCDYSNNKLYKSIKEKSKGRKIFLYDPHHCMNEKYKWGTFKIYGLDILNYFKNNKDIFLIYRPHPLLPAVLKNEYNSDNTFFNEYKCAMDSENIFYDNSDDYLVAMHLSDFLISDANTFVPEFTMYNKPVIYTKYPRHNKIKDQELESMIYTANNFSDIIKYINMLKVGKDSKKELRSKKIKKYFNYNNKKTVAVKLCDIIKKEIKK